MSTVAIQGVRGSYSEEATNKLFGNGAEIIECLDFAATFKAVSSKRAEFAVVPVENKIVGEIAGSMSLLRKGNYRVFKRLPLRVMHVLCGTATASLDTIRTVRSHIEALRQCSGFLAANSHLKQIIGADTAASVQRIARENIAENAAIGSQRAAELYKANILAEDIADDRDNWTTFYLIGR